MILRAQSNSQADTTSQVQSYGLVQRSSFSRSSVSTVRGPAGWSGQRLISRSLIPARTPGAASLHRQAGQLAAGCTHYSASSSHLSSRRGTRR